jgi:hypothetical protein
MEQHGGLMIVEIIVTYGECPFDDCVDYYSFVYQAQVWEAVCSPSSDNTWARQRSSGQWLEHPIKIVSTSHDLPPHGEALEPISYARASNLIDSRDIMPERPRRWDDRQASTRAENIELIGISDEIRQALARLQDQL